MSHRFKNETHWTSCGSGYFDRPAVPRGIAPRSATWASRWLNDPVPQEVGSMHSGSDCGYLLQRGTRQSNEEPS